jgi:hypothetical protein
MAILDATVKRRSITVLQSSSPWAQGSATDEPSCRQVHPASGRTYCRDSWPDRLHAEARPLGMMN